MTTKQRSMQKTRPVNLNLFTIHFPVTAIVSILHRVSGTVLFLFVPFLIWVFGLTLASPDDFAAIQHDLTMPIVKVVLWIFLVGFVYHLIAGLRHLIMDFGVADTLRGGRIGAWLVMLLSVVFAVLMGILLW